MPHATSNAAVGFSLEDYARQKGIAIGPLAATLGLDTASFLDIHSRIDFQAFCRLLDVLATISGDDCFGLHYGEAYRLGDVGPFAFAMLHSPTVEAALQVYRTYQPLVVSTAIFDVDMGARITRISWRYSGIITHPDQYSDFRAVVFVKMMRRLAGDLWKPTAVQLVRRPPKSLAPHLEGLRCKVDFHTPLNVIEFSSNVLQQDIPGADTRLQKMMLELCEREMENLRNRKDILAQVQEHILAALPSGGVKLQKIADELAIGERSLQRRLSDSGKTFEQLVEQTRRELSDRLLPTTNMPLSKIGHLCGYSSASAYSRAARGWYGITPAAYRKLHQPAQS